MQSTGVGATSASSNGTTATSSINRDINSYTAMHQALQQRQQQQQQQQLQLNGVGSISSNNAHHSVASALNTINPIATHQLIQQLHHQQQQQQMVWNKSYQCFLSNILSTDKDPFITYSFGSVQQEVWVHHEGEGGVGQTSFFCYIFQNPFTFFTGEGGSARGKDDVLIPSGRSFLMKQLSFRHGKTLF